MTAEPPQEPPAPTGTIACPRCGSPVPEDQDWCLECGYAARTVVQPTPRWRIPVAVAAIVAALALAGLAVAFVDLTEDPTVVSAPATTAVPTATTPPVTTVPTPTTTTPPATTTPPVTTVPPPATVPDDGATGGATAPDEPAATAPSAPPPPPTQP